MTSGVKLINVWRGILLITGLSLLMIGAVQEHRVFWFYGWLPLLLGATLYALYAGVLWAVCMYVVILVINRVDPDVASYLMLVVNVIGYIWIAAKMYMAMSDDRKSVKTAEKGSSTLWKPRNDVERTQEAEALIKSIKRAKRKDQRASEKVLESISELFSIGLEPANEIIRIAHALNGTGAPNPKLLVLCDIAAILRGFRNANSSKTLYIDSVCRGVTAQHLNDREGSLLDYAAGGEQPTLLVAVLADYDNLQGTTIASHAASIYLGVISEVAAQCGDSLAVTIVARAYTEALRPYVRDGARGESSARGGADSKRCEDCTKGYELLGLPLGSSESEVKEKRRAWAEVLHPDVMGGKSDRARNTGEEQLKNINAACDHIFECRFSTESV